MLQMLLRAFILCLLTFGLTICDVAAESPALPLTGPLDRTELVGHVDALEDADWTFTPETVLSDPDAEFVRIDGKSVNFGYTQSRIWLRIALDNQSPDQSKWIVHFHENFKQIFDTYIIRSGAPPENILTLKPDSVFADRPVAFPQMVAGFDLPPGEEATLLIALWSEGSSYITFSFETPESFANVAARQTAKNFVFYGMMMLLIAIATASLVVFRHRVFLYYSAYAVSGMLYVMHADGVTFQYLWPNLPRLNNFASVFTGSGLIIFGSLYARTFLRTAERHIKMDRLLLAIIVIAVVMNVVLMPTNPQLLKKALTFIALLAVISFTLSAIVAALRHFREVRFFLLAWVGAVISAVMMNLSHLLGVEIGQDFLHDSMRAVMVFDAFMMGLAIADRYNQLRQSRQIALERNLQDAERNLALNSRLEELEKQYSFVAELAETRSIQIQNTVHDLSQPLHALRLSVRNLSAGRLSSPENARQIDETFTYLETLVADQLHQSPNEISPPPVQNDDSLNVGSILASVHQMFEMDARAKGLSLRYVPTRHTTSLEPLVLMRIVTNLVSNAIKYTQSGGVLLGCRAHGTKLLLEVHDTGPGLTDAQFDMLQARSTRLDTEADGPDGQGFGLSIVSELVAQYDLGLRLSELRRSGTGIVVTLPCNTSNVAPFPTGKQLRSGQRKRAGR